MVIKFLLTSLEQYATNAECVKYCREKTFQSFFNGCSDPNFIEIEKYNIRNATSHSKHCLRLHYSTTSVLITK